MTDFLIRTRRNLSYLEPITLKGRNWIVRNMEPKNWFLTNITIAADTLEDFLEELRKDDIEYEER